MQDFSFIANSALVSNLDRLTREQSVISEQRMLEISDVASSFAKTSVSLFDDGLGIYDVLSMMSEGIEFCGYSPSEHNSSEREAFILGSLGALSRVDKAVFCAAYVAELKKLGAVLKESDFLEEGDGDETFTYVRNVFSDEAYDVFSQDFDDPRLKYSASFKECAQALNAGEVTYCLLPLEEKGGVRLTSVAEIIFRNDFKINALTPVFGTDGNADMKYALVSKKFTVPAKTADDDRYLEIRVGASDGASLTELLSAADFFSMSVYRVNTALFNTEGESEAYYSIVIRDGADGFVVLLTYLALFGEDFVPVGIYKNVE